MGGEWVVGWQLVGNNDIDGKKKRMMLPEASTCTWM